MQDAILRNLRKVVTPQFISETSRKVRFHQRCTSQISGISFTQMLIKQIGSGREMNYSNLNDSLSNINPCINISNRRCCINQKITTEKPRATEKKNQIMTRRIPSFRNLTLKLISSPTRQPDNFKYVIN